MLLEEIGGFLEDANIGLTVGLNLYLGFLPKDPTIAVGLIEVPGEQNVRVFVGGTAGISFEKPRLQIQVRDKTYEDARTLANTIEGLLEGVGNRDISGTRYGSILAMQPPFLLQRFPDEELTPYVTVAQTYQVQKKRSAA